MPTSQTIAVAGLGPLGRGIVTSLLARGLRVIALETDTAVRADAKEYIAVGITELVTRGGMPESLLIEWPARYTEATDVSDLTKADFVIESIFENIDAKKALFDQIEAVVGPTVPIASNTSALPISSLQSGRKHPERFVGMHWAMPCHITRFLEVIRGEQTNDATIAAALALGKAAGKQPTLVKKDIEGFIVNRIGYAVYREALWLLENGIADVETIDNSVRNARSVWGNIAGPFRWMDISGLAGYAAVMEKLLPKLSCAKETPKTLKDLVDSGARGIANGRGFYQYTPEEAERWKKLVIENAWRIRALNEEFFPE